MSHDLLKKVYQQHYWAKFKPIQVYILDIQNNVM